jgi:hypothetical protein
MNLYILVYTVLASISCSIYNIQKTIDACIAADKVTDYLDNIALNPKLYLTNQNDDCVFKLIDTLRYNSVLGSARSLEVLGLLYRNSDGEISEYFDEIGVEIFYSGFDVFANFIYLHRKDKTKNVEKMIIRGMSFEISMAKNRRMKREDLKKYILNQCKKYKYLKHKTDYLLGIEKQMNPSIFD